MVDVSYQMVLSTLQTVGLLVGIFYYIMTMRINQKNQEIAIRNQELTLQSQNQALETRQAQMFMQVYDQSHNDPTFIKAMQILLEQKINTHEEFQKKREDQEVKAAMPRLGLFFEGLGVLVKEGYVSIKLVALLMTGMTRLWWEGIYKSWIEEGRKEMNLPRWMSEAEYLYDELMKYVEEHPELAT